MNKATFDRYLDASGLSPEVKQALREEFESAKNPQDVYNKAVSLSGRKSMTKVPRITTK